MQHLRRGRLFGASSAPEVGERVERLVELGGSVIEQIVSGELDQPVEFNQDHDEWFVLLQGGAELEVEGETLVLGSGEWMFLPSGTPHRLVATTPGSSWLAVHGSGR